MREIDGKQQRSAPSMSNGESLRLLGKRLLNNDEASRASRSGADSGGGHDVGTTVGWPAGRGQRPMAG